MRVRSSSFAVLVAVSLASTLVVAGCGMGSTPAPAPESVPHSGEILFSDSFDRADGLVTNEYAFWNPGLDRAVVSPDWEMTSGSLFTRAGAGWTGTPDDREPDARSTNGTDSAVFRLTTKRADHRDVAVAFDLRLDGMTQTATTPPVAWDGVHVFLRYQSEESLYYASVDRRDGTTAIKKKVPGGPSNGGTYHDLASGTHVAPVGSWEAVRATVGTNADGSVTIELYAGGRLVARAVDHGTGGPPITHAGKVGIRGDNAEFDIDAFRVTAR